MPRPTAAALNRTPRRSTIVASRSTRPARLLRPKRVSTQVVKLNPKDSLSLFYLAQIALAKNDLDGAIASLNRATVNDARLTGALTLLTSSYLRRAATSTDPCQSPGRLPERRACGRGLDKTPHSWAEAITLFGQALIGSKQYARAASVLERATTSPGCERCYVLPPRRGPFARDQFPEGNRGAGNSKWWWLPPRLLVRRIARRASAPAYRTT